MYHHLPNLSKGWHEPAIDVAQEQVLTHSPLLNSYSKSPPQPIIMALQLLLGSTVVSPYVGMARKQNGGYNASISVQTLIFYLVMNPTRLKTVRSALWHCPNSTVALRLLENVVKVTNLEVVKIEFRHLPILLLLSSFFFSQPSALTRAVLKTKHPQIAVKFFEDVPFELSF